jgi:hypothetical protein
MTLIEWLVVGLVVLAVLALVVTLFDEELLLELATEVLD